MNIALVHASTSVHEKVLIVRPDKQVVEFVREITERLEEAGDARCVFYVGEDVNDCINAVLLVSAYLVLVEGWPTEQAAAPFKRIANSPFRKFLNGGMLGANGADTGLSLEDCLDGLRTAEQHAWLDFNTFDAHAYRADAAAHIAVVCPALVAFEGQERQTAASLRRRGVAALVRVAPADNARAMLMPHDVALLHLPETMFVAALPAQDAVRALFLALEHAPDARPVAVHP